MKISVIVPTYKPRNYLWQCLDSLVRQTLRKADFEVILILNGCTDPWKAEIEKYIESKTHEINIKFIHTEISGVSNARNLGIDNSEGEYITFVDDDDYVSPTYLAELVDASSKDTIGLAHPIAFNSTGKLSYVIENEYARITNKKVNYLDIRRIFQGPCMKAFHRSIVGNRRFDITFKNGEDALFMFLLSDRFKYVKATSYEAIYYRRVRDDGAAFSKKKIAYKVKNSSRLIRRYWLIYFNNMNKYNTSFFLTRVMGAIKMIFY